jgi:hypothetical protein
MKQQGGAMGPIDPDASSKLQTELLPGESIFWAGRPNPSVIFHSDDWYLIPFSLLWGGFAIFWEASVLGYLGNSKGAPSTFMSVWGIPFVVFGQYMIWGRFLYDAWLKRRTYYALTNRRVLILQEGWKRKTNSTHLVTIPSIEQEGSYTGTLWFGPKYPLLGSRRQQLRGMSRFTIGEVPVFADIDDVDSVYRLALDFIDKGTHTPSMASH